VHDDVGRCQQAVERGAVVTSIPGLSRSSTTLRLLRIQVWNPLVARFAAPPGGSTATTSAPASARISVATGPAMPSDRSTMRMPSRMPGPCASSAAIVPPFAVRGRS
jgi:hypothetical protein